MRASNSLDRDSSTVLVVDRREEPAPPWSKYSTIVFAEFELTERLPEQAYFWTSEWQKDEQEADEDIRAGRVRRFPTAEELIADLDSLED